MNEFSRDWLTAVALDHALPVPAKAGLSLISLFLGEDGTITSSAKDIASHGAGNPQAVKKHLEAGMRTPYIDGNRAVIPTDSQI